MKKHKKLTLQRSTIRTLTTTTMTVVAGGMSANRLCTESTCHGTRPTGMIMGCEASDFVICG